MTFDPDYICTVQVHAVVDEDILSKTLTKFYQKGGALDMNDTIYVNNNKWVVIRDPIYSISLMVMFNVFTFILDYIDEN